MISNEEMERSELVISFTGLALAQIKDMGSAFNDDLGINDLNGIVLFGLRTLYQSRGKTIRFVDKKTGGYKELTLWKEQL